MESILIPYHAITRIPCKHALIFAPHPDDEVFGCGGAIMRHIAFGDCVSVIVVSDGAFGIEVDEIPRHIALRQNESIAAAKILGCATPIFWNYPDRHIRYDEKLIQAVLTAIQEIGADLIYAPSPLEAHPDHRMLAMAVIEAVRRTGKDMRLALYEIGVPLHPNTLLDISEFTLRKAAAMECFASQITKQRYDLHIAALNRYRTYTLPVEITAAEAFLLLSAEELADDPLKLYQSEHARQRALNLPIDNSDLPLVSIIIRSMDRPTLSDALDSVALQTYPNIEAVVVNAKGGKHSPLNRNGRLSINLINDCGNPLSRSIAANSGLSSARGTLSLFLDDDDLIAAPHIALLVDRMQKKTNLIAAYTAVRCIDEQGNQLPQHFGRHFSKIRLMSGNFIPIHAVIFKSDVHGYGCRFDEALHLFEDWDFWLQLAEVGDFDFISEETAYYRISSTSGFGINNRHNDLAREAVHLLVTKWQKKWDSDAIYALMELCRHYFVAFDLLRERNDTTSLQDLPIYLQNLINDQQHLNHRLEQIKSDLNQVLNSTSWRITAPLRKLVQVLRK
ncbi:MAG: PIG-L family deacetylase [Nitrosomonas sp.]|nr:MAG: PIG-L family deacetylase [Nitrosomonas sp.]